MTDMASERYSRHLDSTLQMCVGRSGVEAYVGVFLNHKVTIRERIWDPNLAVLGLFESLFICPEFGSAGLCTVYISSSGTPRYPSSSCSYSRGI